MNFLLFTNLMVRFFSHFPPIQINPKPNPFVINYIQDPETLYIPALLKSRMNNHQFMDQENQTKEYQEGKETKIFFCSLILIVKLFPLSPQIK